jgi:transposase InsO family protein
VRERRDQLRHPHYAARELLAARPNELWSWDITKPLGPTKWTYYYLDVVLDVFSRYAVGWMLAQRESASLAEKLIAESCERQKISPGQLTVHVGRGVRAAPRAVPERAAVTEATADCGLDQSAENAQRRRGGPRRTLRLARTRTDAHSATPNYLLLGRHPYMRCCRWK